MSSPRKHIPLILSALLFLQEIACSSLPSGKSGVCVACHSASICCHTDKKINIKALRAAWESSFHKSLLHETFQGCPHLNCARCHPRLASLEINHQDSHHHNNVSY